MPADGSYGTGGAIAIEGAIATIHDSDFGLNFVSSAGGGGNARGGALAISDYASVLDGGGLDALVASVRQKIADLAAGRGKRPGAAG